MLKLLTIDYQYKILNASLLNLGKKINDQNPRKYSYRVIIFDKARLRSRTIQMKSL